MSDEEGGGGDSSVCDAEDDALLQNSLYSTA